MGGAARFGARDPLQRRRSAAIQSLDLKSRNRWIEAFRALSPKLIFDTGGNRYRLVAVMLYRRKAIYIRFVGTDAEYDKIDAVTI